jgi:tetratricopeptide (TPR) repeat protein
MQKGLAQTSSPEGEFSFAHKLYDDKLFELAGEQLWSFAKKYPSHEKSDDALFMSGNAFFDAGDFIRSFASYKELEIAFPQSEWLPQARFRLAQTVAGQKKFAEAAELFKRVAIFHPDSEWAAKAYLEAGRAYSKADAIKQARNCFLTLIQSYPDSPQRLSAHLDLVDSYFQRNDYEEALFQIDGVFRAFGTEFKDPRVYLLRASVFTKLGQTNEAEAIYLKLIKEFPTDTAAQEANFHLAEIYAGRNMGNLALPLLDKFISNSSDSPMLVNALANRAEVLYSAQRYDAAIQSFEEALARSEPEHRARIQLRIGQTLQQLDRLPEAARQLEAVRRSGARDSTLIPATYFSLAEIYIQLRKHNDAISLINEFSLSFPKDPHLPALSLMNAEIFEKHLNDYSKALRAYDRFTDDFRLHPDVDDAHFGMARCYESLGDYRLASRELANYLTQYPAGDNYQSVLERYNSVLETFPVDNSSHAALVNLLGKVSESKDDLARHFAFGRGFLRAKEFSLAALEFRSILQLTTEMEIKREAYYFLAESYFHMAEKSRLSNFHGSVGSYLDSAAVCLSFFASDDDSTELSENALLLSGRIEEARSKSANSECEKCMEIYGEYEQRFPNGKAADAISIKLANNLLSSSSPSVPSVLEKALRRYQMIDEKSAFSEEAQFKEAKTLAALGADTLASEKLSQFISRFPRGPYTADALFQKAQIDRKLSDLESATAGLERLISEFYYSPLAPAAQKELADVYLQAGDFQSALEGYQKAGQFQSHVSGTNGAVESSAMKYHEAAASDSLGNWETALALYLEFVERNPGNEDVPAALLAIADICQRQNNLVLAREYYQRLLSHNAEPQYQVRCHTALGDIFFKEDLFDEAFQHYSNAAKLAAIPAAERYPASQAVRCRYRLKQFAAGDSDAEAFKRKFKGADEFEGQFLADKGQAYISDKDFEQAEKVFKKLRSDFKSTDFGAEGEFGLGKVYLITNHTEDALKILTEIPTKYPESSVTPLTYFNLGDFYYKSQQVENAIAAFKNVLTHPKADSYRQSALRYLIKCYTDLMWWDLAIVSVREYLTSYPYSADAFDMKIESARLLMNLREYSRAIEDFRALQPFAAPESEAEIQFYIAQCYREMGNFERAVAEYLRVNYLTAPTKLPWHVTALFEASKCLINLGEIEEAKTILKRIVGTEGMGSNFGRFAAQRLDEIEREQSVNR